LVRNGLAVVLFLRTGDPFFAVLGQTLGFISTAIIYAAYTLAVVSYGSTRKDMLRTILSYGLPYGVGLFVMTICIQFYNVVAAISFDAFTYGNFSAAWLILSGIMVIPMSLSSSMFPSFSETQVSSRFRISAAFSSSVKFASSILLFTWITIGGASDIIIGLIYGSKYSLASEIFVMLSSVFVLSIIGWGVINPLLLSLKKTKALATINLVSVAISVLVIEAFIDSLSSGDVWVIPLAFFILHASITALGLAYLRKEYGVSIPAKSALKLIMIVLVLFYATRRICNIGVEFKICVLSRTIDMGAIFKAIIAFLGVGLLYVFFLIVFKIVTREDYEIMKNTLLSSLKLQKILGKIVEPAFTVSEKMNSLRDRVERLKQMFVIRRYRNASEKARQGEEL